MRYWKKVKLGDIAEMCLGKMLDKGTNKGTLQPYLANFNVRWGSFDLANLNEMPFEESEQERYGLQFGDIVMCEGGEPGRCAIWKDEIPNMKIQKALHRIRIKGDFSGPFTYYRFLLARKTGELQKHFIGSTIKHLTGIALKQIEFSFPSLEVQRRIAAVLSALDAKIELNRRINAELEAMAKTLYDYWFVQFDFPDANGKPYKSSGGKMVWSGELGREVPEGWEVKKIKEIANTASGGTPLSSKKEFYDNGHIPWINSGELNNQYIISTSNFITTEGLKNSSAKIFPQGTVLVAMYGATAGKVSLLEIEACTNQAICAILPFSRTHNFLIKFGFEGLYEHLVTLSSGSARDNLSQEVIRNLSILVPNDNILLKFNTIINSSTDKIVKNLQESHHLTALRDWLLPLLMNGQVRVG